MLWLVEAMLWASEDRDHYAKEFEYLVTTFLILGISGSMFAFFEAAGNEWTRRLKLKRLVR